MPGSGTAPAPTGPRVVPLVVFPAMSRVSNAVEPGANKLLKEKPEMVLPEANGFSVAESLPSKKDTKPSFGV